LISAFDKRVDLVFKNQQIGSNIIQIYRFVNLGMVLTLTLQLYYQKRIITFLNNGLRIAKVLLEQTPENFGSKLYRLHLVQLILAVVWWILLTLLLLRYFLNPNLIEILLILAIVSPVIGMTAMSAIFIVCMRLLLQGYTCIGEKIYMMRQQCISDTSKSLTKQCQLSDNLDLVSDYFRQLNDLLRTLGQVLSVPIFFFISISFVGAVRGV
jgi:7tm Chemosensory receptor